MFYVTLLLLVALTIVKCEDVHAPIRYHSQTGSGTYSYGYDTGSTGSHQFHHEYKDTSGQHLSRYGYTDPDGKFQSVYYRSGPQSFDIINTNERTGYYKPGAQNSGVLSNSIDNYNRLPRTSYKPTFRDRYSWNRRPVPHIRPQSNIKPYLIRKYRDSGNSRVYMAGRDYGERSANLQTLPIHRVESPRFPLTHETTRPIRRTFTSSANTFRPTLPTNTISSIRHSASLPVSAPANRPLFSATPVAVPSPVIYSGRGILSPSAAARLRAQSLRST